MKKKMMSLALAVVMCLSLCVPAFAATTQPANSALCVEANIPEGMVLLATDVSIVDDGEGHRGEVTIHEYGKPGSTSVLEQGQNGIKPRSMYPEYEVGYEKYFTFQISNEAIGLPSFVAGTPLTSAMKSAISKIVKEKLGEKLAASFIPGLNIASWVLAAIALTNGLCGNKGFQVVVDCVYSETYLHGQGYSLYGWDIKECSFGVY